MENPDPFRILSPYTKIKVMKKIWLLIIFAFISCEKEEFIEESECCTECTPLRIKPDVSIIEQTCCDWDAVNFDPEWNGYNVNQLYFTGSLLCNNELCIYPNY